MNGIQVAILGLALALNSFSTYLVSGNTLKKTQQVRFLRFGIIILASQVLMSGTGLWLGLRISGLAIQSNYYIAFGILLIMGIKIIMDSIRQKPEEKAFDLTEIRTVIMLSVAEGITPLIVSSAIGLTLQNILPAWFIIITFQLIAIITGLFLGSRDNNLAFRLRTGPIGGLIMLAAALKLFIDLVGF